MASFIIEGGHRLSGDIIPQGAKNEALQVLCAVLLTSEPVTVHNVPDIADVANLIRLLERMGVSVQSHGHGDYTFQVSADFASGSGWRVTHTVYVSEAFTLTVRADD